MTASPHPPRLLLPYRCGDSDCLRRPDGVRIPNAGSTPLSLPPSRLHSYVTAAPGKGRTTAAKTTRRQRRVAPALKSADATYQYSEILFSPVTAIFATTM